MQTVMHNGVSSRGKCSQRHAPTHRHQQAGQYSLISVKEQSTECGKQGTESDNPANTHISFFYHHLDNMDG